MDKNRCDNHQSELIDELVSTYAADGQRKSDDATLEDLPPMRAVSLLSQPVTLKFSMESENDGQKVAKSAFVSRGGMKPLARSTCEEVSVRREWNEESKWNVSTLDQVPFDFPLERTRREIRNLHVSVVVHRISDSLRLLSVEAEYDSENAKAKCKTNDLQPVSFRIRLFAGEDTTQELVIVEIQRRSGSPSCFMRICKKILDGAEGAKVEKETIPAKKISCIMNTPITSMKCLQSVVSKQDSHKDVIIGINKSLELMRVKEKDVNLLGLENLCYMTDPLKTRPDMAMISCKAVITGQQSIEIRDEIGIMLQKDTFLPEQFEVDVKKNLSEKRRHLAVVLLSNVLALTSQDGCLTDAVENQKWFTEFLIPSLLDEIKSFEVSANNAYEAACSLTYLAVCSDIAKRVMKKNSAVEDLQIAHQFALYNHQLLAVETKRSLEALGHPI